MTPKAYLKKIKSNTPLIVTWMDAADSYGVGVKVAELSKWAEENGPTRYDTLGFFMGVVNERCFLGFNKDSSSKSGLYRGVAEIPLPMIEHIYALQR